MGLQETFTREGVRQLVKAYAANLPLAGVRASLGEVHIWNSADFRSPAPRVEWTKVIPTDQASPLTEIVISHDYDEDDDEGDPEGGVILETVVESDDDHVGISPVGDATGVEPPVVAPASKAEPSKTEALNALKAEPREVVVERRPAHVPKDSSIEALIQARAQSARENSSEEQEWLESTAQKLRSALLSYNLQAKITQTRLTPNAALIRFMGSDRLRVEDIEGDSRLC